MTPRIPMCSFPEFVNMLPYVERDIADVIKRRASCIIWVGPFQACEVKSGRIIQRDVNIEEEAGKIQSMKIH